MAKNKNRNPDNPELEEEVDEVEEESSSSENAESSGEEDSQTRTLNLDRTFTYGRKFYGPGKAEVPVEAADSIEKKMKLLQKTEERERKAGEAALAGGTQTQVNNTVAPFVPEMKYSQGQPESEG